MAPGPLVPPPLNGQKRDSKREQAETPASSRALARTAVSASYLLVGTLPFIVYTTLVGRRR